MTKIHALIPPNKSLTPDSTRADLSVSETTRMTLLRLNNTESPRCADDASHTILRNIQYFT